MYIYIYIYIYIIVSFTWARAAKMIASGVTSGEVG